MSSSTLRFHVAQAQTALSKLLQDISSLSPQCEEEAAVEISRFSSHLNQLISTKDCRPAVPEPEVKPPAIGQETGLYQSNEDRVGMVLRGARAGIFIRDIARNTSYWTPELRDLIGADPDEQGSPEKFLSFIHPEDRQQVKEFTLEAVRRGGPFYTEFRLIRPNGETIWLSSVGFVEKDPEGRPISITGINQDITPRKNIESALRESERQLRESERQARQRLIELETIYQNAPIGLCVFDNQLRWVRLNQRIADINGVPLEEHLGKTPKEIVPDVGDQAEQALKKIMETGLPLLDFEMRGTTAAQPGVERFWNERWAPIKDDQGKVIGITVAAEEITERRRAEEALLATSETLNERNRALEQAHNDLISERNRLLAVMQALPIGLAIYDEKGGVIQANPGYEAVWGSPRPPATSVDDYDLYKAWWVETGKRVQPEEWAAARSIQHGETVTGQYIRIQRFDGSQGFVLNSGAPVQDTHGNIIGCTVAIMDITERVENELRMEVQRRLMEQREQERHGIARDIHDGPIQTLASTVFNIQLLKEAIPDPTLAVELNQITLHVKNAIRELREVVNDLRPPSILRFGLTRAIQIHVEDLRERYPETRIELDLSEDPVDLSDQAALTVFRVFQEAMNNVYRHAAASRVWVRYVQERDNFALEVGDDGKGLAVQPEFTALADKGHYGLAGMKERAEAIGGEFQVWSQPGAGTRIVVRAPLLGINAR